MRIGIIGARNRNTIEDFYLVYDKFFEIYSPGDAIISGGCTKGGDKFAEMITVGQLYRPRTTKRDAYISNFLSVGVFTYKNFSSMKEKTADDLIPIVIYYPDKSLLPPNPDKSDFARINYARNTLIAQDSDILIACVSPDRKGGTEDTIKKYLNLNKNALYIV
jgi:hypothetical protein